MKRLSAEEIQSKLESFYSYIDKYISKERAIKLKALYEDHDEVLMTAPASSKAAHHNCFPGGYLDHVLNVVETSLVVDRVWDKFGQNKDYTIEELVFSAINHDLGKLGTNKQPFYIPNDSDWHIKNQGAYYKINTELTHMRIADRSLYVLQKYGIQVSENEYFAIKLHDGMYEEANKPYFLTHSHEFAIKTNLVHVLHQADFLASKIETQKIQ